MTRPGPVAILCLAAATTGATDVFSFTQLGGVFASAMTGNIALVAYALVSLNSALFGSCCLSLVAFSLGVILGAKLTKARRFSLVHAEALLLALFAFGTLGDTSQPVLRAVLIALASCAMGMQIILGRTINLSGIPTTVFTSTLTSALTGITSWPLSEDAKRQWLVLLIYATGGLISALACHFVPHLAGLLPLLTIIPAAWCWRP